MRKLALTIALVLGTTGLALSAGEIAAPVAPAQGSVSAEQGLEAWSRIYQVASHPRCSNCHAGEDNVPMWSGPSYGKTRPHGMNITAGESRIGAQSVPCATCHVISGRSNDVPHAPPHVATDWRMAPVEAHWFGLTSQQVCDQFRDPERNGGLTYEGLAAQLNHNLLVQWAWNPGGGREPAPYSLREHIDDILAWGAAGMPCPR